MVWFRLFLLPAILGFGVVVLNPSLADAQKGGGGGGRPGGGAPSMGARPGGSSGAYHPGGGPSGAYRSGVNHYPSYIPYRGYGYGYGYGYPYLGIGIGIGGYNYSPYSYGNLGSSYYNSYYPPAAFSGNLYPPPTIIPTEPVNNDARIEVRLPVADAVIALNGDLTRSTGTERLFSTPPLESGFTYSYQIVATWMQGGEKVRVERTIQVAPGRTTLVDFTRTNTEPRMPVEP